MTPFHNLKVKSTTEIVADLVVLTNGGADYTFNCTGNTEVMRQHWKPAIALECLNRNQVPEARTEIHPSVTARHRSRLESLGLWRRQGSHRYAQDR